MQSTKFLFAKYDNASDSHLISPAKQTRYMVPFVRTNDTILGYGELHYKFMMTGSVSDPFVALYPGFPPRYWGKPGYETRRGKQ